MNPTELFPSPFPSLFRGVGLLSSSSYKIVTLKSAWTTLKHPEWIDISVLTTLHQNTTETIFLYLWPLTLFLIFTPFFTLDKGAHVSLASKSCWVRRWVFRWKPFLVSVFSQPPAVVPALLNSVVLWSSSPQHACPSQVQLAYVTCWLSRQTARTPAYTWLSCPSCSEKNWMWKA